MRPLLAAVLAALSVAALGGEAEWEAHSRAGMAAFQRGDYRMAGARFQQAVKEAEAFGQRDARLGASLNNLANAYRLQRRFVDAEPLYRRSLAIRESTLGPEHEQVGETLTS